LFRIFAGNITQKQNLVASPKLLNTNLNTHHTGKGKGKGKGKDHSITGHEGQGWSRGIALLFL